MSLGVEWQVTSLTRGPVCWGRPNPDSVLAEKRLVQAAWPHALVLDCSVRPHPAHLRGGVGSHADQEDAGHEGEPHPGLLGQVGLRQERMEEMRAAVRSSEPHLVLLFPAVQHIYWKPLFCSSNANKGAVYVKSL